MEILDQPKRMKLSSVLLAIVIVTSLFSGGLMGYVISYRTFQENISSIQSRLENIPVQNVTYVLNENVTLSQVYDLVKESVVTIQGEIVQYDIFHRVVYSEIQGSGFVYNYTGKIVIITNYHVIQEASSITVTFTDGDAYSVNVLGSDPYEDLAILSTNAPLTELIPLNITSSSSLEVGDPVIAVGNPYGLSGSMTTGIVSALGRTISEEMTGGYPIADSIQTSTPINPGNSGGPLLDYQGHVIGITTAIVSDSQGLGFAIPSNTILREVGSLIVNGSYNRHPWLGATGVDMTYDIASSMKTNFTYGWLVVSVSTNNGLQGGTSRVTLAGQTYTIGGDIIIAIDGIRIRNIDDLSTYLEGNTLPNQTINATIIRNNQRMTLSITLGTRPLPTL